MLVGQERDGLAGPIRVVLVDVAAVQRRFLRAAVESGAEFTVVGEAHDGREAVALVARLRPAAVLMDLDLPVLGGIETIEQIMSATPTPILVVSAFAGPAGTSSGALQALAAGAVDVLAKPDPDGPGTPADYAEELRAKLRVAARIRVITHPRGRLRNQGMAGITPASGKAARGTVKIVAIGASTGGPRALLTLLAHLPADLAQAVLVVQHMSEGFIPGLATWLDEMVPLPVVVGASGHRLQPGTITIAPGGRNLLVQDDQLRVLCLPPDRGQFHVPGIDATFASLAHALGPLAVGVVLTGMGRDGAAGLLQMRTRGALTLAQDEATSAVYGMPAAAVALAAVDRQLPLEEIAAALLGALGRTP